MSVEPTHEPAVGYPYRAVVGWPGFRSLDGFIGLGHQAEELVTGGIGADGTR
jgi:hypothetical protein